MFKSKLYSQNSGFTLIEMSVIILIVSVLMGMAIGFALPIINQARLLETQEKIKLIETALAEYAVQNNRIPCPTTPIVGANYGFETGNGVTLGVTGYRCASNVGMVPFRTLNIPEQTVIDAWGNPMTYAVSPSFILSETEAQNNIHARCRTRDWFYSNGRPLNESIPATLTEVAPINSAKASFCCPGNIGSDLSVADENGSALLAVARSTTPLGTAMINITTPTTYVTTSTVGVAYMIVSHGENQLGAYETVTGTRLGTPASACEVENTDNDVDFRDCAQNDNTGNAFFNDDITGWATQDLMFASLGESCAVP